MTYKDVVSAIEAAMGGARLEGDWPAALFLAPDERSRLRLEAKRISRERAEEIFAPVLRAAVTARFVAEPARPPRTPFILPQLDVPRSPAGPRSWSISSRSSFIRRGRSSAASPVSPARAASASLRWRAISPRCIATHSRFKAFRTSIVIGEKLGDKRHLAMVHTSFGRALIRTDREAAVRELREGFELDAALKNRKGVGIVAPVLIETLRDLGRRDEAMEICTRALAIAPADERLLRLKRELERHDPSAELRAGGEDTPRPRLCCGVESGRWRRALPERHVAYGR